MTVAYNLPPENSSVYGRIDFTLRKSVLMILTDDGDVGIGPASAADIGANLHLYRASAAADLLVEAAGTNGAALARFRNDAREYQVGTAPDDSFRIYDATSTTTPLMIEPASPTNALYVDSSGDVGFGTGSPVGDLNVVRAGASLARFSNTTAGTDWNVGAGGGGNFAIWEDAYANAFTIVSSAPAGSLYVDASGDIGVGTTSPNLTSVAKALTLSAGVTPESIAALELQGARSGSTNVGEISFYSKTSRVVLLGGAREGADDAGALRIFTKATGTGIAERMRVDSAGRVGIGTTAPGAPLEIALPTANLEIVDAQSTGGTTGSGYVTYRVGGATRYGRLYATA